ncbi:TerB family tellurite resistance protein [Merismopedia glauca]|uniref:Tellurite resistance protein TerB n=1 Tax=Merismopedia glauca CCAP 1448/3 TaxID=1296344 RepID=A0A2T1C2V2_9CYAN|nr:TerB family tellurite resistance protein [Merismopedia glauca]PSB02591.1 Tellurite resistance protein TerB [Merismopedia glauca CCAP 1448/3]
MTDDRKVKQMMKILIGAAWLDGKIQPEEKAYLEKVAKQQGVGEDSEIQSLLNDLTSVKPEQFYQWLEEHLGDRPSVDDYNQLIDTISGLIYSDGDIDTQEAELLNRLQALDPAQISQQSRRDSVLKTIQKLYRRWIAQQG